MPQYRRRRSKSSLARRRRKLFGIKVGAALVLVGVLVGGLAWLSHLPKWTVTTVHVHGTTTLSEREVREVVEDTVSGSYPLFFARANIMLVPFDAITRDLRTQFPRIKSVDTTRGDLKSIDVFVEEREPFALWCGENFLPAQEAVGSCYFLDEGGLIFMKAPDFSGPVFFRHFGALPDAEPVGVQFVPEEEFRNVHFFLTALDDALERTPSALAVIDGVDIEVYFEEGGKIIFERSQQLSAVLNNATAAFASDVLAASDRPLEYVDFRFGNKAYYKFESDK